MCNLTFPDVTSLHHISLILLHLICTLGHVVLPIQNDLSPYFCPYFSALGTCSVLACDVDIILLGKCLMCLCLVSVVKLESPQKYVLAEDCSVTLTASNTRIVTCDLHHRGIEWNEKQMKYN